MFVLDSVIVQWLNLLLVHPWVLETLWVCGVLGHRVDKLTCNVVAVQLYGDSRAIAIHNRVY